MKKKIKSPKLAKALSRYVHPINLHIGVMVSIAAIIATMFHSGADMVHALYAGAGQHMAPVTDNSLRIREIKEHETHIGHAQISCLRRDTIGSS